MSETIKLSFDDGYKNIELNGNPDKIIRINPTDTQLFKVRIILIKILQIIDRVHIDISVSTAYILIFLIKA